MFLVIGDLRDPVRENFNARMGILTRFHSGWKVMSGEGIGRSFREWLRGVRVSG